MGGGTVNPPALTLQRESTQSPAGDPGERREAQETQSSASAEAELEERLNLKLLRATYGDTWLDTGYPKSGLLGEK